MPITWDLQHLTAAATPSSDIVAVALVAFDERGVELGSPRNAALYDLSGQLVFEDKTDGASVDPRNVVAYPIRGSTLLLDELHRLAKLMRSVPLILMQAGVVPRTPPPAQTSSWLFFSRAPDKQAMDMQHMLDSLDREALAYKVDYTTLGQLPCETTLLSMHALLRVRQPWNRHTLSRPIAPCLRRSRRRVGNCADSRSCHVRE